MSSAKDYISAFQSSDQDGRMEITEEAQKELTKTQFKLFLKEVKRIEQEGKPEDDGNDSNLGVESINTGAISGKEEKGLITGGKLKNADVVVSEEIADDFWKELENMSGVELLSSAVVEDFQYVGFDPNTILKSVIRRGMEAKKSKKEILKDIATMCAIAIIKGSITDKNLKKMSEAGKRTYSILESSYGLRRGGSKGVDPQVVTISRVGAAFPGSMMRILQAKPDLAKKFSGPFGSKILPSYLRHQSAAACIPETMEEGAKEFILGMIIAYTSDQSKIISQSKESATELYDRQENFINQTHGSSYPREDVRKQLFKQWSLIADYDKLNVVSSNIIKHVKTFSPVSKEDLQKAIAAV